MPSLILADKGKGVRVGRDSTVKGALAEALFSVSILVFNLSVSLNQKEIVPFLSLSSPSSPLLCINNCHLRKTRIHGMAQCCGV